MAMNFLIVKQVFTSKQAQGKIVAYSRIKYKQGLNFFPFYSQKNLIAIGLQVKIE